MKKIALEKLIEVTELCKSKLTATQSIEKKELFSRAFGQLSDIIVEIVEKDGQEKI